MKKINLAVTGCLGRMGSQIIKSARADKRFKLVTITENKKTDKKIAELVSSISYYFSVEPGENAKNLKTSNHIWEFLTENGFKRNDLIINLGGGMVSDLGGFVASTYMRGVQFINIPTTLLGMVDASIGGKTGIDLNGIKNIIGTFQFAKLVLIDVEFLNSLSNSTNSLLNFLLFIFDRSICF